jgi:hypothetical protein
MEPGHKYKPGYASLATEVLRDAQKHGVKMEKSIWAEYLLWHQQQMRTWVRTGEITVGYKNREREDHDN